MTSMIQSIGTGVRPSGRPQDGRPARSIAGLAGLLLAVAVVAAALNWWQPGPSAASDVPDSPGVGISFRGLNVLDAYLVPAPKAGTYSLRADITTTAGPADRLLSVAIGSGTPTDLPSAAPGSAPGLPVNDSGLLGLGGHGPGTYPAVVVRPAVAGPQLTPGLATGSPGTFLPVRFTFAHRGRVTLKLPIWATAGGPA